MLKGRGFKSNGGLKGNDAVLSSGKCICNNKTMPAILYKRPDAWEREREREISLCYSVISVLSAIPSL